jgi:hypothetical protein
MTTKTRKTDPDAARAAELAAERQAADLIGLSAVGVTPEHRRLTGYLSNWKDKLDLPTRLTEAEAWTLTYMREADVHPRFWPDAVRWTQWRIWGVKVRAGAIIDPELQTRAEAAETDRLNTAAVARSANATVSKLAEMVKAGTFPADVAEAVQTTKAVWIAEGVSRLAAMHAPQGGEGV